MATLCLATNTMLLLLLLVRVCVKVEKARACVSNVTSMYRHSNVHIPYNKHDNTQAFNIIMNDKLVLHHRECSVVDTMVNKSKSRTWHCNDVWCVHSMLQSITQLFRTMHTRQPYDMLIPPCTITQSSHVHCKWLVLWIVMALVCAAESWHFFVHLRWN